MWDIQAEIAVGQESPAAVAFTVRGEPIRYDVKAATLHCLGRSAPLEPQDGRIKLHVLVDRTSIEIFANDGRIDDVLLLPARSGGPIAEPERRGW